MKPKSLQCIVNEIREWAQETFGNSTPQRKIAHLKREINEVLESPSDIIEWADCAMLFFDALTLQGFTVEELQNAMQEKLEINKKREWSKPDHEGVQEHKR